MHAMIIGGGVIGLSTAFALQQAGMQVTVVEQQPDVGMGASFANGGQLSYSHAEPWVNTSLWRQLPRWLRQGQNAPVQIAWNSDPELWLWLAKAVQASLQPRSATRALLALACYSQKCLQTIVEETKIEFNHQACGTLHLYRSITEQHQAEQHARWQQQEAQQQGYDCPYELLDKDAMLQRVPALQHATHLWMGGVFHPLDAVGDALHYCRNLKEYLQKNGVHFVSSCRVISLQYRHGRITELVTDAGERVAIDQCVLANATDAVRLIGSLRKLLILQPMQGFSVTLPMPDEASATLPVAMTDTVDKLVYSPLGNKLRIAGFGRVGERDISRNGHMLERLKASAAQWLGQDMLQQPMETWSGLRPATPSGAPVIGQVPGYDNLYLNTGHGTLGWTLSAGSAYMLRDAMLGEPSAVSSRFFVLK